MRDVHVAVLTRRDLTSTDVAGEFVRVLLAAHPDLAPVRFGNFEPLKHRWQPGEELAPLLRAWKDPFLWSNGRRAEGSVAFAYQGRRHSAIYLSCVSSKIRPGLLAELTSRLAQWLDADLAYVYPAYESRESYLSRYKAVYPMYTGVTTHELRKSLPELPWFTIFGKPYVELFGVETLLSTPAHSAEQLPSGAIEVQLTSDPPTPRSDPAEYEAARNRAKEHLGTQHFLDLTAPDAQRRAPSFDWSPAVHNPLGEHLRANGLIQE